MKTILMMLAGLTLSLALPAQSGELYDDDYYDDYFDGDYDEIYKYGFRLNNYAGPYADPFVLELAREYGVPRSELRYYIRKGFAPSDVLFGLELSRRSGYPLRRVMDSYYRSSDRNWVNISIDLGIGRMSIGFRHILDRFRHHCRYWNDYYARRHPHRVHPPVYNHSWSYFRPHAPHHMHRPGPSHTSRPPHAQPPRPAPGHGPSHRPQPPHVRPQPRPQPHYRRESGSRPAQPSRPDRPSRPAPSRPDATKPEPPKRREPPKRSEQPRRENYRRSDDQAPEKSVAVSGSRSTERQTASPASGRSSGGYRR